MDSDAIFLLIDYCNFYLSRISIELEKLINYCNGKKIVLNDVESNVTKDLEYSVFELTESLGKGEKEKSFQILNDMLCDKKIAQTVFGLVQNYFRRMFFVSITKGSNLEISLMLGIKEYAVKKAKESAGNFKKVVLKNIVNICADLDYKIKTSQIDYQNAVEYLVLYILENNNK